MLVCAHGDVADFCKEHDMLIVEKYEGDLEKYDGASRVLVTGADLSKYEFYYLKGKLFALGVELVSVKYRDCGELSEFAAYIAGRDGRRKTGGRSMFGYYEDNGEMKLHDTGRAVVKRILELRDAGYSYSAISKDENVHHLDGKKLSVSTVHIIVKNREKYEKEGL